MRQDFQALPETARLFIFSASRELTDSDAEFLGRRAGAFIDAWKSHNSPVFAGFEIRYARFLLIGIDETKTGLSGCSIDGMVRELKSVEQDLGVTLVDAAPVYFRSDGGVERASRSEFGALARAGRVGPDTIVFNNTVTGIDDLRAGRWETPLKDSWHARAFGVAVSA